MNTFRCLVLLAAFFAGLPFNSGVAVADDEVRKVVYHADFADPRRFSAMLTSINNMVTYYQDELVDYDVRIVFIAHGIRFVTDDKLTNTPFVEDAAMAERRASNKGRLESLRKVQGVKLELCDITTEFIQALDRPGRHDLVQIAFGDAKVLLKNFRILIDIKQSQRRFEYR